MKEYRLEKLSLGLTESLKSLVTAEDVERFAEISGDVSPIHVSDEFARSMGFTGRLAHGILIGARISSLIGNQLPGKYGVLQNFDLEFRTPLIPPEEITITGEVVNISAGTGQVTLKIQVRNSQGKLLANCQAKTIVRSPQLPKL